MTDREYDVWGALFPQRARATIRDAINIYHAILDAHRAGIPLDRYKMPLPPRSYGTRTWAEADTYHMPEETTLIASIEEALAYAKDFIEVDNRPRRRTAAVKENES